MLGDGRARASRRASVAVIVNAGVRSALAARACGLFEPLRSAHVVHYLYREAEGRERGGFLRSLAWLRPALVYVLDTAVSGAGAAILARRLFGRRLVVDTGDLGYELADLKGQPAWIDRQAIRAVEASAPRARRTPWSYAELHISGSWKRRECHGFTSSATASTVQAAGGRDVSQDAGSWGSEAHSASG